MDEGCTEPLELTPDRSFSRVIIGLARLLLSGECGIDGRRGGVRNNLMANELRKDFDSRND